MRLPFKSYEYDTTESLVNWSVGLNGRERFTLYLTALSTGFRVNELASLAPESFDFTANPSTIHLSADVSKNGQEVYQPISADVALELQRFMKDRPQTLPLWPTAWTRHAAKMMRHDLASAGIPYEVEGPNGKEYADFHCLRHTFISRLALAGIAPKIAQTLARHSDVRLTLNRYSHVGLHDMAAALEQLPSVLPNALETIPQRMSATGTENPVGLHTAYTTLTQTADTQRLRLMSDDNANPQRVHNVSGCSAGVLIAPDEARGEEIEEASPGFEPGSDGFANRCLTTWRRGRFQKGISIVSSKNCQPRQAPLTRYRNRPKVM